jgi:hypothetical protein
MSDKDKDDDRNIWGAREIAIAAHCYKEDGTPDVRKAFYMIEHGYLGNAVAKVGRLYVSTPRRIREAIFGEEAA